MKNHKILIVEDESLIALDIKRTVLQLGYRVTDIASNEKDVFKSIKTNQPDIILMDIFLKNSCDGIEITRKIQQTKNIPVIYLTGSQDDATVDRAIETNPVSFITKPFKRADLRYALQLGEKQYNNSQLPSNYTFNVKENQLYYKDKIQKIGNREKIFLNLLFQAEGKLVTFETIENVVWENDTVSNDAIRLMISRLRKKLEYDFIETIYSFGFKLKL
ncbi:MAG: response regulator [Campylobacterales bacterium]|nr:response regulator [Campylobacterales bacterium]